MYNVRVMRPINGGRQIEVTLETYAEVVVALRVAVLRARSAGVLAIVERQGGAVVAQFGLGMALAA